MMRIVQSLALAGLATAALEPRELLHRARSQPTYVHHRDVRGDTSDPCAILAEVFESANAPKNQSLIVDTPPSIGLACLKSVPLDKKRDLALLEYLRPYVSFQSTIETLADPPEEYLLPGVDILGGLDTIEQNLKSDKYKSQYEVMDDLRSIFVAAADNHFDYPPALLNTILFVRRGLNFTSLSADGVKLPQLYGGIDVDRATENLLDYRPSPVKDIDGTPVTEWLEADAVFRSTNFQDPDAQYNAQFGSIPGTAAGKEGGALTTTFEIPDNYTINFYNGSSSVVYNQILFPAGVNFTGITSGEKFQQAFEIPPENIEDEDHDQDSASAAMAAAKGDDDDDGAFPGYPEPYVKQSYKSVAGYLPEAEGYDDIAVLSILSFTPMGVALSDLANLNMTDFILEGRDVIVELFEAAKKEGRDKLILDLSTNGGGSILLAQEVYRLLFPDGKFTSYDRFRANDAIKASVEAQYEQFVVNLIDSNWPLGPRDADIQRGDKFFGPYIAAGQNVTAPFITNLTQELAPDTWLNGNEPDPRDTLIPEPYFDPENILIITDGTCASACGILTGLLTRNHGVRTLALGGRATRLPMQAMGGVKGTIVNMNSDIRKAFTSIYTSAAMDSDASEILKDAEDALPVVASEPPLMPLNRGDGGGRVNGRNGYTLDDLDGYPVHFRYEAANCRLFYTPLMMADVRETWRRAADAAWYGAPCVHGSTANEDNTISDELPEYDSRVRSRVPGIKGPGSLED